ncbi:Casein Kinase Ii Subunit Alpha'-Interacting Protein [Manis pentadactyla]|nr:Casein Kinase Ii Subunit Alpha'-Interacting Protein [Manis pentadactyla]
MPRAWGQFVLAELYQLPFCPNKAPQINSQSKTLKSSKTLQWHSVSVEVSTGCSRRRLALLPGNSCVQVWRCMVCSDLRHLNSR